MWTLGQYLSGYVLKVIHQKSRNLTFFVWDVILSSQSASLGDYLVTNGPKITAFLEVLFNMNTIVTINQRTRS